MEKEVLVVKEVEPIKEYNNYITLDNKVLGVTIDGFEEIPFISGLFKIGVDLFFSIEDKLYTQSKGVITEIQSADFPIVPESKRVEFASGIYKIENSMYKDIDISLVYKRESATKEPRIGYYSVDGACVRGNDLIYSCPADTGNRLKGVYIWSLNGNALRFLDSGRIW